MPRRLLLVVLVLAVAVRAWGLQFGLPYAYARPDETEVAGPAVTYLSGNLRPPFFQWPSLFSYLVAAAYAVYGGLLGSWTGFSSLAEFADSRYHAFAPFLLIPRALSLTMGVFTVGAVYAVGRRWLDDTVAIVASFFLALTVLHVRDSHFGMADVTMTALVVLATLAALRWDARGGLGNAVIAGLLVGLAGSTKYNGLAAGSAFAASIVRHLVAPRLVAGDDRRPGRACVTSAAAFALAVAIGFFGGSPYILIDWSRFVADVGRVQDALTTGHGGMRIGRGWWHFGTVVLPAGMGLPVVLAGTAGLVLLLATRFRESLVVLIFPVAYYLYAGQSYAVFARYILPVVPFLCLTSAWLLVATVRRAVPPHRQVLRAVVLSSAAFLLIAPSAWRVVQLDRLLAQPDNRVVVAHALADVLPSGDRVYQSGASYGRVPLGIDGRGSALREVGFDADAGTFDGAVPEGAPEWVIVQRSPLVMYSRVPPSLEARLRDHFTLVATFPTAAASDVLRVYDQQDAFYLPLVGLAGLRRPGPAFELYRRRPTGR